jgi:hypothetical protein
VAVIATRDPPPLFTWESFPQIYPSPALPRYIGARMRRGVAVLLAAVLVLLVLTTAGMAWQGELTAFGPTYTVAGHVLVPSAHGSTTVPVAGAEVNVSGESGFDRSVTADAAGGFRVAGVPTGAITVNVTAPGFSPLVVELFASPVYSAGGSLTNLTLTPTPGGPNTVFTSVETEYPTLESLLAVLFSGSALLAISTLIAGAGLWMFRREHLPWGVVGGMAGVLAPVAIGELGIGSLVLWLSILSYVGGAVGVVVAVLAALLLASQQAPEPPDRPIL